MPLFSMTIFGSCTTFNLQVISKKKINVAGVRLPKSLTSEIVVITFSQFFFYKKSVGVSLHNCHQSQHVINFLEMDFFFNLIFLLCPRP